MKTDYLTHDELQHIEHANNILREHRELVTTVVNETESLLNNYVPILKTYISAIATIQHDLGMAVADILRSTREMKIVTSGSQEIQAYIQSIIKLGATLDDEKVRQAIEFLTRKSNS